MICKTQACLNEKENTCSKCPMDKSSGQTDRPTDHYLAPTELKLKSKRVP